MINGGFIPKSVTTDETTLTTSGGTISVKDGGISEVKIASDAVSNTKVADAAIGSTEMIAEAKFFGKGTATSLAVSAGTPSVEKEWTIAAGQLPNGSGLSVYAQAAMNIGSGTTAALEIVLNDGSDKVLTLCTFGATTNVTKEVIGTLYDGAQKVYEKTITATAFSGGAINTTTTAFTEASVTSIKLRLRVTAGSNITGGTLHFGFVHRID